MTSQCHYEVIVSLRIIFDKKNYTVSTFKIKLSKQNYK